jgi:hypothetical protein
MATLKGYRAEDGTTLAALSGYTYQATNKRNIRHKRAEAIIWRRTNP